MLSTLISNHLRRFCRLSRIKIRGDYVFRYGFLEIDQVSFEIIVNGMLDFNPLEVGTRRC
jgi:hypothetical protein